MQKEKARSSAKFGGDRFKIKVYENLGINSTKFLGYETLKTSSVIVGMIADDVAVEAASEGTSVEVFLLAICLITCFVCCCFLCFVCLRPARQALPSVFS